MDTSTLLAVTAALTALAYVIGRGRSLSQAANVGGIRNLNSLPFYYGMLTALWCGLPALALLILWVIFDEPIIHALVIDSLPEQMRQLSGSELGLLINSVENIAAGNSAAMGVDPHLQAASERLISLREASRQALVVVVLCGGLLFGIFGWARVRPQLKARVQVETTFKLALLLCSCIAIVTTLGIVLSVLFESLRFFQTVSFFDFIFGLDWSPQMAIRADQVGSSGAFGAVPLFVGTLLISAIAMLVAVPTGLMAAIYLSEYAGRRLRAVVKPLLEVLAGIPTVVYGFFAALTVAPMIRDNGAVLGLDVSSESALAAGLVMGVMIIPFVSSLSDDVINAVPQSLRDGSFGLGATRSETIRQVVIPAALPGIVGGVLLAVSRAIGETMIVVMAAGLAANLTANPLESVTTVTVQIVTLLVGDQEFDSPKTLSAFALGLMLFVVTLTLNYIALHVVRKYREQYE
ncbi:phosphate ABC transporter permease subunit PstC [Exilibacterium tricleocarpae]|uniref:Phosphate transport system permease protein n=1 Tax=Exilibacterium tricleocarpae TaxID=2591008 RepID=A0A545TZG9_9GAMM|nr:phosphate ABC transporter permease subunit PstC [Exilibacterium tricleocarpae]TQV82608.1 phosphate ABC transporter permease subunit PstC [Exilibacterium tricleocarpae]